MGSSAVLIASLLVQSDYEALYEQAQTLVREERLEEALPLAQELLAKEPKQAAGYFLLGELYRRLWRPQEAIDTLSLGADKIDLAAVELHRQVAVIYAELHAWEGALEYLERSLSIEPAHAPSLYAKAMVLSQKGDRSQAMALYQALASDEPDNADVHFRIGEIYESTHRLDDAETAYRRAIELDPRSHEARFRMGKLLVASGRTQEAERHLARAVQLSVDHANSHLELAHVLETLGRAQKARHHFERAVELDPWLADAYLGFGHFALQHEEEQLGRSHLAKAEELTALAARTSALVAAVELHADDFEAQERLVEFLIESEQFPLAVRMIQGALLAGSDRADERQFLMLARAYDAWGRQDDARRILTRAAALFPESTAIQERLRGKPP